MPMKDTHIRSRRQKAHFAPLHFWTDTRVSAAASGPLTTVGVTGNKPGTERGSRKHRHYLI